MNSNSQIELIGKQAKASAQKLRISDATMRISALHAMAKALLHRQKDIVQANELDLEAGRKAGLSEALLDRLMLNGPRIEQMAKGVLEVADQEEVLGSIISTQSRSDGLVIKKQLIPLGVLGMIFESRPNVVIDCAAIAIKSANAIILKGGKEAFHSNQILGQIVADAISAFIPRDSVQVLDSADRSLVEGLLTLNQYVDVIIPRGGQGLIEYVYQNATMPVIAHFKGLCHLYIHQDANLEHAKAITLNAKAQRPGVCNAIETLLLHKDLPRPFLKQLFSELLDNTIQLRVSSDLMDVVPNLIPAQENDWSTEYLDRILSVKTVSSLQEAIEHIQKYGTHHTEGIVTQDPAAAQEFLNAVDASCIAVNSSTRFNDGGQLGSGAELGISTSKLHAYGPMGVRELMTSRYVVEGAGHVRT